MDLIVSDGSLGSPIWEEDNFSSVAPRPMLPAVQVLVQEEVSYSSAQPSGVSHPPPAYDFQQFATFIPHKGDSFKPLAQRSSIVITSTSSALDRKLGGAPETDSEEWSSRKAQSRHLLSDRESTSDASSVRTFSTTTTSSTVKGIGMISGRLIKALGARTIEAAENFSIRRRLSAIRARKPAYWVGTGLGPMTGTEYVNRMEEVREVIDDLRELLTW